ncbi:hypothetical protein ABFS82_14G171800 [Erythranthe guttata]
MYSRKTVSIIISLCIIIACCFTSSLEASRHLSMTTTTPTNSPSFNASYRCRTGPADHGPIIGSDRARFCYERYC